jgi:hypothetical protein
VAAAPTVAAAAAIIIAVSVGWTVAIAVVGIATAVVAVAQIAASREMIEESRALNCADHPDGPIGTATRHAAFNGDGTRPTKIKLRIGYALSDQEGDNLGEKQPRHSE